MIASVGVFHDSWYNVKPKFMLHMSVIKLMIGDPPRLKMTNKCYFNLPFMMRHTRKCSISFQPKLITSHGRASHTLKLKVNETKLCK